MPLIPLRDRVYIIPLNDPDRVGSLYIPENAKQRVDQGIVRYRGDACLEVRAGDHVIFSGYSGDQIITEEDGLLYVMREDDIIALYEPGEPQVVFTSDQAMSFIDKVAGEMVLVGHEKAIVDGIIERFKAKFKDYLFSEMF